MRLVYEVKFNLREPPAFQWSFTPGRGGGWGALGASLKVLLIIINNSLYLEALPEGGTFLRLLLRFIKEREFTGEVNKRVEIKMGL